MGMPKLIEELRRQHTTAILRAKSPKKDRMKTAYLNSFNKTGSSDSALQRWYLARALKEERAKHGKLIGTRAEAAKKAQRKLDLFKNTLKANKHLGKKRSFDLAFERMYTAELLRKYRRADKKKIWGVSFNTSLKKLNKFYSPINIIELIKDYSITRGISSPSVLEIGCGNGKAAVEMAIKLGDKAKITATGLRWLKEWGQNHGSEKVNWKIGHAEDLTRAARDESIDIIHSNLGFANAVNETKALKEAHRVLKKGGLLVFTTDEPGFFYEATIPKGLKLVQSHQKEIKTGNQKEILWTYILRKK
jgi:SAM-dependent methyltransferase